MIFLRLNLRQQIPGAAQPSFRKMLTAVLKFNEDWTLLHCSSIPRLGLLVDEEVYNDHVLIKLQWLPFHKELRSILLILTYLHSNELSLTLPSLQLKQPFQAWRAEESFSYNSNCWIIMEIFAFLKYFLSRIVICWFNLYYYLRWRFKSPKLLEVLRCSWTLLSHSTTCGLWWFKLQFRFWSWWFDDK